MVRAIDGMKECAKCHEVKSVSEFYRNRWMSDGLCGRCKACEKVDDATPEAKARRKALRDRPEAKANLKAYGKVYRARPGVKAESRDKQREWARIHPHMSWVNHTIYSHRGGGYAVNITAAQLEPIAKRTTHCSICGVALAWETGTGFSHDSPSLDRKDNGQVMTIGNVWIVCHRCNATKRDRTFKEFVEYCKMIVDKFGEEVGLP